jgi:hypothetical protein
MSSVEWIREYLQQGTIPILGPAANAEVRILDQGTRGFAIAETSGSLWDGWVELYRLGFLRGVLVASEGERWRVLIGKKSRHVRFDIETAARLLNQMEIAMGEGPKWGVSSDELWLEAHEGTLILLKDMVAILTRV